MTEIILFKDKYPNIDYWINQEGCRIDIGDDEMSSSFVKALDQGGVPWEGKREYNSLDEVLLDLENGIKKWLNE